MNPLKAIGKNLAKQFGNFNFLPQKLDLEDMGMGLKTFLEDQNFSLLFENGVVTRVPIIYISQELWAERKVNWKYMRSENGEEVSRPYIALSRKGVKKGSAPSKFTIPNKRKFTFVKVPVFDGTLKGYELYKIPQPVYTDIEFDVKFVTHYAEDVDSFYKMMFEQAYCNGQGYLKVNGYDIASKLGEPSENNTLDDINAERLYHISFPVTVLGKIIDPKDFERVNTIKKISLKISEK
jgi:hypothetical protein